MGSRSFWNIFSGSLRELLDTVKELRDCITDWKDVNCCDFPNWTRQIEAFSYSGHDKLRLKGATVLPGFLRVVIDLGAHDHMYCSEFQINTWHELLMEEMTDLMGPSIKKHLRVSDDYFTQVSRLFYVNGKAFANLRASRIYGCDLKVEPPQHTSVLDCALEFLCTGLSSPDMVWRVDYSALQDVGIYHLGFNKVLVNFSPRLADEVVCKDDKSYSSRKKSLSSARRSFALVNYFVCNFSLPRQVVMLPLPALFRWSRHVQWLTRIPRLLDIKKLMRSHEKAYAPQQLDWAS